MKITNNSWERKSQPEFKAANVYIGRKFINAFKSIYGFEEALKAHSKFFENLNHKGQDIEIYIKHRKDHNENDFTIIATALQSGNNLRVNSKVLDDQGEYISSSVLKKKEFINIGSIPFDKNWLNKNNTEAGKTAVKTLIENVSEVTKFFNKINSFSKHWLKEIENPDSFERII